MAPLPVCLRQGTSFAALAHCHSFAAPPASRRLASHSLSQAGPSQSHEYLSSMSCRTQACHSIVLWLLRIVPPVLCTEYLAEHPRRSFKSTRTTRAKPRDSVTDMHACTRTPNFKFAIASPSAAHRHLSAWPDRLPARSESVCIESPPLHLRWPASPHTRAF